jgi:hypothetical protein
VFWEKRLQAVENKEREVEKESKERPKRLQIDENTGDATESPRESSE